MKECAVLTTINPPNETVKVLSKSMQVIVVGDKKTPVNWFQPFVLYMNPDTLPFNSYARKNFGYLEAMRSGADKIFDTDDDNIPNASFKIRDEECMVALSEAKGWCNVYRYFTNDDIWQRGIPLNKIHNTLPEENLKSVTDKYPIQQGMVDNDPDVDAICRMIIRPETRFKNRLSVAIPKGTWSPFNSQSTWWFKSAFPLMYLPQTVNFRVTDIWRSLIAQRILWSMGHQLVFHSPAEVTQERNPHNLMADFEDEIPMFINNERISNILTDLKLTADICSNMTTCYDALMRGGIISWKEKEPLKQWIKDVDTI